MLELAVLLVAVLLAVIAIELAVLIRNVNLHTEAIIRNMGTSPRDRDYELWKEGFNEQPASKAG